MHFDVIVIGGGSAGAVAALTAAGHGLKTLLLERENCLGGTSTLCGVNCWEPAAGTGGVARKFFARMSRYPRGAAIYSFGRHCCDPLHNDPPFPGGENVLLPEYTYDDTLQRAEIPSINIDPVGCRRVLHGVIFEPEVWHRVMTEWLAKTGCCEVQLNSEVCGVERSGSRITAVTTATGRFTAAAFIDACGILIRLGGLDYHYGREARATFGEASAPIVADGHLNGVSRVFRITPVASPGIETVPDHLPRKCWWRNEFPAMVCTRYPNGDGNCNMLPTFDGDEFDRLTIEEQDREGVRRVRAYWHHIQCEYPEFRHFRLHSIFPRSGVRETIRTVCEYMLTEQDLVLGLRNQSHRDIIAVADHIMDRHGGGRAAQPPEERGESVAPDGVLLPRVYGIPFRSLIPKGMDNLLVAGRIAGFSSLAASSCRLSRTMMLLGEAAGHAVWEAARSRQGFRSLEPAQIQAHLSCLTEVIPLINAEVRTQNSGAASRE